MIIRHKFLDFINHEKHFLFEQGFKKLPSDSYMKAFQKKITDDVSYFIRFGTGFGNLNIFYGVSLRKFDAFCETHEVETFQFFGTIGLRKEAFVDLTNVKTLDEIGDDFRQFYFEAIAPFFEANNHLSGMFKTLRKVKGRPVGNDENHSLADAGMWADLILTRVFKPEELEGRANHYYQAMLDMNKDNKFQILNADELAEYHKQMKDKFDALVVKMQNLDIEKLKADLSIEGDNEA